jgi:aldehyde:ferredoxin oxidoreductase
LLKGIEHLYTDPLRKGRKLKSCVGFGEFLFSYCIFEVKSQIRSFGKHSKHPQMQTAWTYIRGRMIKGGYAGKLLFVNLTNGTIDAKPLSEEIAVQFVGGYGIGARILYEMMKKGSDPLGPDSVLGFVSGPLNATGALFGGRYTVVCKSPITGGWNDANSGGFFGPQLKRAGFDAVFVSGVSKKPVYLFIKNGKAEIRDAKNIWGKDCPDAQEMLIRETGEPNLSPTSAV